MTKDDTWCSLHAATTAASAAAAAAAAVLLLLPPQPLLPLLLLLQLRVDESHLPRYSFFAFRKTAENDI